MISAITIEDALPSVFSEMRSEERFHNSQVWLSNVAFEKPHSYMVVAESGTGKSSLCAYIYGNRRDYEGRILFDGVDISTFNPTRWSELRQRSLAYLPQQLSIFPELTTIDNILIKNQLTDRYSEAEIRQMLQQLGVDDRADVPAGRLSIGQQQRVAIVRALSQPFDFLLLDEPVSHLDSRNNSVVADLISQRANAEGAAIIATSVGNHLSIDTTHTLSL